MTQLNPPTVAELLGEFIAQSASPTSSNSSLWLKGKLHLLDAIAASVATRELDEKFVGQLAATVRESGQAAVIGEQNRFPIYQAAFLNGALIHGCDFDDAYYRRVLHTEPSTVGTAFTLASFDGGSAAEMLDAWSIGTEVTIRLALACNGELSLFDSGFHNSAVFGCLGAAATAARFWRLSERSSAVALALASCFASGLAHGWNEGGGRSKSIQVGAGAMNGLLAAALARSGTSAALDMLEADKGLFATHSLNGWDAARIGEQLGDVWELGDIHFKLYPAGAMVQGAVDCALDLHRSGVAAKDIQSINIEVPVQYGPVIDSLGEVIYNPGSPYEAFASWPVNVAMALSFGEVTTRLVREQLRASQIQQLTSRTRVAARADEMSLAPEVRTTSISLETTNGPISTSIEGHRGLGKYVDLDTLAGKLRRNAPGHIAESVLDSVSDAVVALSPDDEVDTLIDKASRQVGSGLSSGR